MWSKNLASASTREVQSESSAATAALQNVAQYVTNYIDLVENVPNEIIRQVSVLHEHNHQFRLCLNKLDDQLQDLAALQNDSADWVAEKKARKRKALPAMLNNCLVEIQALADEKLYIVQSIYDHLDTKARQLDLDYRNIAAGGNNNMISPAKPVRDLLTTPGFSRMELATTNRKNSNNSHAGTQESRAHLEGPKNEPLVATVAKIIVDEVVPARTASAAPSSSVAAATSATVATKSTTITSSILSASPVKAGRGLKRAVKAGKEPKRSRRDANSPPPSLYEENPADPDEPTYCLCNQISFGEMIGCDNNACLIEWFHFQCVQLITKPKGKWYCPQCRGDRSNVLRK